MCALLTSLAAAPVRAQGKIGTGLENLEAVFDRGEIAKIAKVVVFRIPDEVMFSVAATPSYMRLNSDYTVVFKLGKIRLFEALLSGVTAGEEKEESDMRWGVLIIGEHDKELGSLFVDATGRFGYVNDRRVSFQPSGPTEGLVPRLRKILAGVR
ncbi:MAG TPA: hypothetical protein VH083_25575 [Myxococcales bacterium]|jgi:hypothetical protein|nr:hypothetical protein [Myxococcales bacterium]